MVTTKQKITNWIRLISHFLKLIKEVGLNAAINIDIIQFFKTTQYKHDFIISYFEKEFSEIINKYMHEELPSEVINPNCNIWVCWFQGESNMPETIIHCFKSIKKYARNSVVQLITMENFQQFVTVPHHIVEKVEHGQITLTHFSDILRCNLLAEYGGVYIDAGLLLTDELLVPELPFFSVKLHKPENDCSFVSEYRWLAGFMGGVKGNALHSFMRDFFNEYWKERNMLIDYFLVDYIIATAYNNIPSVKKMIDDVPYNNEDIYYIGNNLFTPVRGNELSVVLRRTRIFRIGYKGFPKEIKENSLYHYIFT